MVTQVHGHFFCFKFPRDFEEQAEVVQRGVNVLLLQRG